MDLFNTYKKHTKERITTKPNSTLFGWVKTAGIGDYVMTKHICSYIVHVHILNVLKTKWLLLLLLLLLFGCIIVC